MSDSRIQGIEPMPEPRQRPSRLDALTLWAIAAAGLLISSLLTRPLAPMLAGMSAQLQLLVSNLVYYLPFVILPVFLLAKRRPGLYEAYRPYPISLFDTISVAVLALVGMFMVNDITVLWCIPLQKLGLNPLSASLPVAQNKAELMLSIITVAVVPAVCEEFLFRGAILSGLEGRGTKRAMWITSLLFMMIHGSFAGMPTQIILGMVLSMLVVWTHSIYAGLIYHTVHNASAVILEYIQSQSLPAEAAADTSDLFAAIGGMGGILTLMVSIAFSAALFWVSLRLFRLRGQLRGISMKEEKQLPLIRREKAVFTVGAALCLLLYAFDFIAMLGG